MCICNWVLPIREIHMKFGISKTTISYEIWHLQAVTVFLCSYKIQHVENPNVENQQFQGADFAGQDVSNLSSETKR